MENTENSFPGAELLPITLAKMNFEDLEPGMMFRHPEHGLQIILDLSRGQFGPIIQFHASDIYSGHMPDFNEGGEEEDSVFETIARNIYPFRAEQWTYVGKLNEEEQAKYGLHWSRIICPHCGYSHRLLSSQLSSQSRSCRKCGMFFSRTMESDELTHSSSSDMPKTPFFNRNLKID
jgi:hypothetical protein